MPCASQAIGLTRTRWLIRGDRLARERWRARGRWAAAARRGARRPRTGRGGRGRRTRAWKASSALRIRLTAPSGWPQAPRRATSEARRSTRSVGPRPRARLRRSPRASSASASRPCTHGPHWRGALPGQPARHARGFGDRAGVARRAAARRPRRARRRAGRGVRWRGPRRAGARRRSRRRRSRPPARRARARWSRPPPRSATAARRRARSHRRPGGRPGRTA